MSIRLNKLLARRGVGARRKCDLLIQQGSVRVNGQVVLEPGTQVEPERDRVLVDGRPLAGEAVSRYYVLNKPVGVITTLDDPEGRRTIREFLPPGPRLFPVGRLDADTSGLLILTNDGELAHRLMHPRYGVVKTYRVRLERAPGPEALRRLQEGVEFEPGVRSSPARVRVLSEEEGDALLQIQLHEGRYRQVRRMCEAVGLPVRALHRSAYGPLRLGPVQRGVWRELSEDEVRQLRAASARPRSRSGSGYVSPRSLGGATNRLARRLGRLGVGGEHPGRERPARGPAGRASEAAPSRRRTERPLRRPDRRTSEAAPSHRRTERPLRRPDRRTSEAAPSRRRTERPLRRPDRRTSEAGPSRRPTGRPPRERARRGPGGRASEAAPSRRPTGRPPRDGARRGPAERGPRRERPARAPGQSPRRTGRGDAGGRPRRGPRGRRRG